MPYRFFEGKPVGDSRLCATHWGPWREVLLSSNLHFTVTPPPHPQCSGIRPNSVGDTKVQLNTPCSHLEHPIGRGQAKGMRAGAKLSSKTKPTKSAGRRVPAPATNPAGGTARELRGPGKSARRGKGTRTPAGAAAGAGAGSAPPPESRGRQLRPHPHGRALASPLSNWGCRSRVAAASAASRAVPRRARAAPCPPARGPLASSSPPPPGSGAPGRAAGAGGKGVPRPEVTGTGVSQGRGLLPIPLRPGLFRSQHGRRRRLLPDAPVGGGSRGGGGRLPSGPAWWKPRHGRRRAAAAAATPRAEPARRDRKSVV